MATAAVLVVGWGKEAAVGVAGEGEGEPVARPPAVAFAAITLNGTTRRVPISIRFFNG
jgi:hypothetical protein